MDEQSGGSKEVIRIGLHEQWRYPEDIKYRHRWRWRRTILQTVMKRIVKWILDNIVVLAMMNDEIIDSFAVLSDLLRKQLLFAKQPVVRTQSYCFAQAVCFFLFHISTHFLRRPSTDILETFPHDVASVSKEALLYAITKMRNENPQISRLTATY